MYFTESPKDQVHERQMKQIPHFQKTAPPIDTEQKAFVINPQKKDHDISKPPHLEFRNHLHESLFKMEVEKLHAPSATMLTALYLFTADHQLWNRTKQCIHEQNIHFIEIPLAGLSVPAYTLYKAAVTLCSEREELSFSELSDRNLISHALFSIICQALSIRRYGASPFNAAENNNDRKRSVCK